MAEQEDKIVTKDRWVNWAAEKLGKHPTKNFKFGKIEWCYAFYRGEQYKIWDERKGSVRDVNIPRETRSVYNICRPFVDAFVAKMLKDNPTPFATPFSTNTEEFDENISLAFGALVEHWWKSVAHGTKNLRKTVRWGAIGGIGIDMVYWDKKMKSGIYDGDMNWRSLNPRNVFFNADAKDRDGIRWVINRFPQEKSVVEDEWGLKRGELEADDKEKSEGDRTYSTKSQDDYHAAEDESTVLVHDIWIRECKDYPAKWFPEKDESGKPRKDKDGREMGEWRGGKHVVVAGNRTLVEEEFWGSDELPFFVYNVGTLLDDIYGTGIIHPILTIQRDRNRLNSIIMENSSLMGLIKWLVPEQANVLPGAFTNEAGELVTYTAGYKPEQTQAQSLPQHIVGRPGELFRDAQFVTKIQDVGLGMIPYRGSQTSPGVIRELGNNENVMFGPETDELREHIQEIMRYFRRCTKHYYVEERIVQIMGENKRYEAKTYLAKNDNNEYDFDIKVGAGFAKSDEAILDQINVFSQGNPSFFEKAGVDYRTIGEFVLKRVGLHKLREDTYADERHARRLLQQIIENQTPGWHPTFSKYINPDAHIKVFTDFTKTEPYEMLDDEHKFAIDYHIDQCNAIKMGMMQPQMPQPGMGPNPEQQPQMPTPADMAEAEAMRGQATGQPMAEENMGQAPMAPQGV